MLYSLDHVWIWDQGGGFLAVGLTDYTQDRVGRAVSGELPEIGDPLIRDIHCEALGLIPHCFPRGGSFGEVKSGFAFAGLIFLVNGETALVNEALAAAPGILNDDPYGRGWLLGARLHSGLPPA